jgi:flagellar operon protein
VPDNLLSQLQARSYPVVATQIQGKKPPTAPISSGSSFADVLKQHVGTQESLHISRHANLRMQQRGLNLNAADLAKLGQAVKDAEAKGAKDTYVLYGNAGFVVNVPNRTVVTAMTHNSETVVTNVDSVVVVPRLDR